LRFFRISQKSQINEIQEIKYLQLAFALPMYNSNNGVAAAIMGNSGCDYANWNWVGYNTGNQNSNAFRCASSFQQFRRKKFLLFFSN